VTHRTSPSAPASSLQHRDTSALTQEQLSRLLQQVAPRQGQWRDEDYLWLTDCTSRRIELTDGHVEVLPMPTDEHQSMVAHLYEVLRDFLRDRGGKVLFAPLRIRIREGKFREPDLVLVRDAGDPRRLSRFWLGADLAIEIVSPDGPERDLVDKRRDYAEARIPEYWIVDPRTETLTVLALRGAAYVEHGVFPRGARAVSASFDGLTADVSAVFDAAG
jgi:Uma2 family endonuclease